MADLTIVHNVRNGQTMSSYAIPPSGKLEFVNASSDGGDLVITPKPGGTLPFCENNGTSPKALPPIQHGQPETVKICNDYAGGEFLYTAQIGTANAEDPIVILERKMSLSPDPLAMLLLGLGVGAGIAYLITRARANRPRPQQG